MERPTAYQYWLYNVSEGDEALLEHLVTSDLISGNDFIFELLEEAGEDNISEKSVSNVTKYLINKIKNYDTTSKRLGTRL
jgi:hypothetical protein